MTSLLDRPRLRPLEARWTTYQSEQVLLLSDRLGLLRGTLVVPAAVGLLLSLCDGTRDLPALRNAYAAKSGATMPIAQLTDILDQLEDALVFEGQRLETAKTEAIMAYRSGPHRPLFHAGAVYPEEPAALQSTLDAYAPGDLGNDTTVRGIISPHIDYRRGGPVYGRLWARATAAARAAEVIVVFGTDHHGDLGQLTLTDRPYATPYGVLPAMPEVVERLGQAIGPTAFDEELHHRSEHSIELVAVWLHWALAGTPKPLIALLCGSFAHFTHGLADPARDERIAATIEVLHDTLAGRRVLAIAAADLAHVGPAFGDQPFTQLDRDSLRSADERTLRLVERGDAAAFFHDLRAEEDRRKYCGLPPIYLLLRYLAGPIPTAGELVSYDQCPADADLTSWVSIAGVLLR